jgi:hypothetical protein
MHPPHFATVDRGKRDKGCSNFSTERVSRKQNRRRSKKMKMVFLIGGKKYTNSAIGRRMQADRGSMPNTCSFRGGTFNSLMGCEPERNEAVMAVRVFLAHRSPSPPIGSTSTVT